MVFFDDLLLNLLELCPNFSQLIGVGGGILEAFQQGHVPMTIARNIICPSSLHVVGAKRHKLLGEVS